MSEPTAPAQPSPADVLTFWREAGPDLWFKHDEGFDASIRSRFATIYGDAAADLLNTWENAPEGALALVIVLDQFPRNMFRGNARSFATDIRARAVAERAIAKGFDGKIAMPERVFFYLPFEHSEDLADQERAVALIAAAGDADLLKWAQLHADIIRRFGRFPHRNALLGRTSTPQEQTFLDDGGFAG